MYAHIIWIYHKRDKNYFFSLLLFSFFLFVYSIKGHQCQWMNEDDRFQMVPTVHSSADRTNDLAACVWVSMRYLNACLNVVLNIIGCVRYMCVYIFVVLPILRIAVHSVNLVSHILHNFIQNRRFSFFYCIIE